MLVTPPSLLSHDGKFKKSSLSSSSVLSRRSNNVSGLFTGGGLYTGGGLFANGDGVNCSKCIGITWLAAALFESDVAASVVEITSAHVGGAGVVIWCSAILDNKPIICPCC